MAGKYKPLEIYFGRIVEYNGDKEYYHDFMVYAKNEKEARDVMNAQARTWYDGHSEKIDTGRYEFEYGGIIVEVETLEKMENMQECMKRIVSPCTVFSKRAYKQAQDIEPWRIP